MDVRGRSFADLLGMLSEGELVVLYRRVQATYAPTLPMLQQLHGMQSSLMQQVGDKRLYKFLYFLLSGRHLARNTSHQVVVEWVWARVEQVREMLDARRMLPRTEWGAGVRVSNAHTGEVVLTRHALERYWQYVCVHPQELVQSMRDAFARAVPASVEPVEAMRRLLRHHAAEVQYLEHALYRIRFVVSKDREPVMVTVELVL